MQNNLSTLMVQGCSKKNLDGSRLQANITLIEETTVPRYPPKDPMLNQSLYIKIIPKGMLKKQNGHPNTTLFRENYFHLYSTSFSNTFPTELSIDLV